MPYPFSNLAELIAYIEATFTANGTKDITGPEGRDALKGIIQFLNPNLLQELIAELGEGGSVGGVYTDDTFAIGTSLEDVLRAILRKAIHPEYEDPTATLASDIVVYSREIGDIISPVFNGSFDQNDAGGEITRALKRNGTTISASVPYEDTSIEINEVKTYLLAVTHGQGACKLNNLGDTDCFGRIEAGIVNSNNIIYTPYRKCFFGFPATTPTTSANVRALTEDFLNPQEGTQFTINIPIGAVKVCFAYPASLRDVESVLYEEFANTEVKDIFVKTTVNVEGANGFTAISYKVFTFTPVEPFTTEATYNVTI
jgi:hypothetical protein